MSLLKQDLPFTIGGLQTQVWFSGRNGRKLKLPDPDKIQPIENYMAVKPKGGFWTSTFHLEDGYLSDWHCQGEEMFGDLGDAWLLQPDDDVKYYVVDTLKDLECLWEKYHYIEKRFLQMELDHKMFTHPIDFEAFFSDYDALQLTEKGQWNTRMTHPLNLYGWDSESTLWGRWKFTYVENLIKG